MTGTAPIRLMGLKSPVAMEAYSASHLVDVAYVNATGSDSAEVFLDDGIDVQKQEDREWIGGILKDALAQCAETTARIEFIE